MPNAQDVAAAVIERSSGFMGSVRLQKLVYYCQAWHLARHGEPLFWEQVKAWKQGPVVPQLWHQYAADRGLSGAHTSCLGADALATINWVVERYGDFSADALSRMTHLEQPWIRARAGVPDGEESREAIPPDSMASYYGRQILSPEEAVNQAVASAAIEGIETDDVLRSELLRVATGEIQPEELIRRELARLSVV